MVQRAFPQAIAGAALLLILQPGMGSAADFPSVVSQILRAQTTGPVSKMSDRKKQMLITCVNKVLVDLPNGRKRFVLEGANFDEQEHRFGRVVMENRAEWKQNIARACSKIAVQGGV